MSVINRNGIFTLAMLLLVNLVGLAQSFQFDEKLYSTPYAQIDRRGLYGYDLAMQGNIAVVGSPGHEGYMGSVFIMEFNGVSWQYIARLKYSDPWKDTRFGHSVDIHNDVIVVGAPEEDNFEMNDGSAYVYVKPDSGWTEMYETAKLTATDVTWQDQFGYAVAIHEDEIVVGAPYNDAWSDNSGAAYVFVKPDTGWADMTQTAKLRASDIGIDDELGIDVDIDNGVVALGAPRMSAISNNSGAIYMYHRPENGWENMMETARITPDVATNPKFVGGALSLEGNTLVTSYPSYDHVENNAGCLYVFTKQDSLWSPMDETALLLPSDSVYNIQLGTDLKLRGDRIIASGPYVYEEADSLPAGAVYVFNKHDSVWVDAYEDAKLMRSGFGVDPWEFPYSDDFGMGLDIQDTLLLASAYWEGSHPIHYGGQVGAVYAYSMPDSGWVDTTETERKLPLSTLTGHMNGFGTTMDVDGNFAVVTAPGYLGTGCAYVLERTPIGWQKVAKLTASNTVPPYICDIWSSVISGDVIALGFANCPSPIEPQDDVVLVYEKPPSGWTDMTESAVLYMSIPNYLNERVIAIESDLIAVSSANLDSSGTAAISLFEKTGAQWQTGTETTQLIGTGSGSYVFGNIEISDGLIYATRVSNNSSYISDIAVFKETSTGWQDTVELAVLTPSDSSTEKLTSLAVMDGTVVAGSHYHDSIDPSAGLVYVFEMLPNGWVSGNEDAILYPSQVDWNDEYFGYDVSVHGDRIIASTLQESGIISRVGAVYVFDRPQEGWSTIFESAKIEPYDGYFEKGFGHDVMMYSADEILVASGDCDNGFYSGAVYIYTYCGSTNSLELTSCEQAVLQDGTEVTQSGTYPVTLTNSSGCDSTLYVDVFIEQVDTSIYNNGAELMAGLSGASYQWIDCADNNAEITGETDQSFLPTGPGEYAVIVDNASCSDTSECVTVTLVDLIEQDGISLELSPNPVSDYLTIELGTTISDSELTIAIIDLIGHRVFEDFTVYGEHREILDISTLPPGVYQVRVSSEKSSKTARFVISAQ